MASSVTQKLGLPCDICPSSWVWAAGRLGSRIVQLRAQRNRLKGHETIKSPKCQSVMGINQEPLHAEHHHSFLWGCNPIELKYLEFEMIENHRNSAGDFSHRSQPSSAPYRRLGVRPFDQISSTPADLPARCVELNIRCAQSQFGKCCCKTVWIQSSPNGRCLSAAATGLGKSLHHHLSWGVQKLDA